MLFAGGEITRTWFWVDEDGGQEIEVVIVWNWWCGSYAEGAV